MFEKIGKGQQGEPNDGESSQHWLILATYRGMVIADTLLLATPHDARKCKASTNQKHSRAHEHIRNND